MPVASPRCALRHCYHGPASRDTLDESDNTARRIQASWHPTTGAARSASSDRRRATGGFEDLLAMLPEGIGVIHACLSVQRGTRRRVQERHRHYEDKVAEFAEAGVDVINPSGAPPFMVLGYDGERQLIDEWENEIQDSDLHLRHQPCRRAARAQVQSGSSEPATSAAISTRSTRNISSMPDLTCSTWPEWMSISTRRRNSRASRSMISSKAPSSPTAEAEAIYMLGPAWRALDIIEKLEHDLGVPVVHARPRAMLGYPAASSKCASR